MEQTQQNLLRVGDIVAEIERNLGSLKRQAAKAERYLVPEGARYGSQTGCLLWVISGHFAVQSPCPFYPRKRTFGSVATGMSAMGQYPCLP